MIRRMRVPKRLHTLTAAVRHCHYAWLSCSCSSCYHKAAIHTTASVCHCNSGSNSTQLTSSDAARRAVAQGFVPCWLASSVNAGLFRRTRTLLGPSDPMNGSPPVNHEILTATTEMEATPATGTTPTTATGTTTTAATGTTPQCQRTRTELDDLRKEYDAVLPDDGTPTPKATRIFNRDFVAGTEEDPQCKCGRHIREHLTQQQQEQQERSGTTSASLERVTKFVGSLAKPDFEKALAHFEEWMDSLPSIPDDTFCSPRKLKDSGGTERSWGAEEWRETLTKGRKQLTDGLTKPGSEGQKEEWRKKIEEGRMQADGLKDVGDPRDPRILGIQAGTGFGKTHALLDAGNHLNATTQIYITYSLDQDLSFDKEKPRITVLARVLMRCFDKTNCTCGVALAELITTITSNEPIIELHLIKFLVWYFCWSSKKDGEAAPHLVVVVDEVRKLMTPGIEDTTNVQQVTSVLGNLARGMETNEHNVNMKCTVIVSALIEGTFTTKTDRNVQIITLPSPSEDTRNFIIQASIEWACGRQKAMIAAYAGCHPRSIMFACEALKTNSNLDVEGVTNAVKERLRRNFDGKDQGTVRKYLMDCVRFGAEEAKTQNSEAKIFMDTAGSIPPAFICVAFEKAGAPPPLVNQLFEQYLKPTQQLEHFGYHYDRFRAHNELPVVPHDVNVTTPSITPSSTPTNDWFKQLKFPTTIAASSPGGESLLRAANGTCTWTGHKVKWEKYLFPRAANHPYIDRACLAEHPLGGRCLVLYQDKINDNKKEAADGLKAAADALSTEEVKKALGFKAVLCIAQVVGASNTKLNDFNHPYVVIGDNEVAQFYTPSFAPAVAFMRQRHNLLVLEDPPVRIAIAYYLKENVDTLYDKIKKAHGEVTLSTLAEYLASAKTTIGYTSSVIRSVFDALPMCSDGKPAWSSDAVSAEVALSSFVARFKALAEKDVRLSIADYLTEENVNTMIYTEIGTKNEVTVKTLSEDIATHSRYPLDNIKSVFDALEMGSDDTTLDKKAILAFAARCRKGQE